MGAYAHRLLGINQEQSAIIEQSIKHGNELEKPGWVRLNLSAIMTDKKVEQVINAVDDLAFSAMNYQSYYRIDKKMLASSRSGIIRIKNTIQLL